MAAILALEEFTLDLPEFREGSPAFEILSDAAEPWELEIFAGGVGYENYVMQRMDPSLLSIEPKDDKPLEEEPDDAAMDAKFGAHKKKTVKDLLEEDYYELLGLGDKKYLATQDDIKKAYRKAVLRHHPDKQAQAADGEEGAIDDELFKRVQLAYDVLTNPQRKKKYDSQEAFDESIPMAEDVKTDSDFYKVFKPVFDRNAKWSNIAPVPSLGDEKTHLKEVEKFYTFWNNFKSWRDFSFLAEYDPEDAHSREERRWMERKNAKEKTKHERAETARINSLVDLANRLDPRMKAEREKQRLKKEEEKRKRMEDIEKRRNEEEQRKREIQEREEEERKQKEKVEEEEKAERIRVTNFKKKRRQRMRQAVKEFDLPEEWVDFLAARLEMDELEAFVNQLSSLPNEKGPVEKHFQDKMAQLKGKTTNQQKESSVENEAPVHWTTDEISTLTKAVIKFPGGTRDRWEKIQKFLGTEKTIKQIIARVKNATTVSSSDKTGGPVELVDSYDKFVAKKKDTTNMKHDPNAAEASVNWEKVLSGEGSSEASSKPSPATSSSSAGSAPAGSAPAGGAPATASAAAVAGTPAAPVAKKPATSSSSAADAAANWSQDEQKALEAAMKKYPASLGQERWTKIAEEVPGRSKKECVERFKHLAAIIKQGKK